MLLLLPLLLGAHKEKRQQGSLLYWNVPRPEVMEYLATVPATNAARLERLTKLFARAGYPDGHVEQQAAGEGHRNLIATIPGMDERVLLVAAHYQVWPEGESVLDDWSGAAMLPLLYRSLTAQQQQHTIIFAAFDGQTGSEDYFESLSLRDRKHILAMVDLDALGMQDTSYYINQNLADRATWVPQSRLGLLLKGAGQVQQPAQTPQMVDCSKGLRTDDTRPFRRALVPSIVVHSLAADTVNLPGTALDTAQLIDADSYYASYELLSTFIGYTVNYMNTLDSSDVEWMKAIGVQK